LFLSFRSRASFDVWLANDQEALTERSKPKTEIFGRQGSAVEAQSSVREGYAKPSVKGVKSGAPARPRGLAQAFYSASFPNPARQMPIQCRQVKSSH
jgi:hypothetical protein